MRRQPPSSERMEWERPSERFLAYLDRLAAATVARDQGELDKLMRMRLSSHVPRAVLDELEYFRRASTAKVSLRAPLRLMRYVHKMRQLAAAPPDDTQLPLALRERDVTAPPAPPAAVPHARRRAARRRDGGPPPTGSVD